QRVQRLAAAHRHPHLGAVGFGLEADAGGLAVDHGADVAHVDGHLAPHDAALGVGLRGLEVLDADVDALDDDAAAVGEDAEHLAGGAALVAGRDDDVITFANMPWHQTTSEARETIFM